MSPSFFFIGLTVLFILLLLRQNIANFLNKKFELPNEYSSYKIETEWIVYLLAFLLIVLITYGMIMGVTDNPFGNVTVGGGIENMGDSPNQKPHRLFDINFDVFKF
jgi:hypothetical protein